MALDLNSLQSAGFKIGNYNQANDSATLYQPGNMYNSTGTRTVSGISKLGFDISKFDNLGTQNSDNPIFSSGRSLGNIDSSGLEGLFNGYKGGAADQAKSQAQEAATTRTAQAPQDAYGAQLQSALASGSQPGQIAPGIQNPFAGTNSAQLNIASNPTPPSPYQTGHAAATAAGVNSPTTGGQGSAVVNRYAQPTQAPSAGVNNFLQNNPMIQQTNQQLMDYLQPATTQANLQSYIDNIAKDRSYLAGLNTQLMNNENIISGTFQDIKDEITKANGFATNSQVLAMTNARNQTLIQNDKTLANLIASAQAAVNTDTTLLSDERQIAQQETQTRMSLLNYQQHNNEFMFNAANDTYKTLLDKAPNSLYNSLASDPSQAQKFSQITGMSLDILKGISDNFTQTRQLDIQGKQADLTYKRAETAKIMNELQPFTGPISGREDIPGVIKGQYTNSYYFDPSTLTDPTQKKMAEKLARTVGGVDFLNPKDIETVNGAQSALMRVDQAQQAFNKIGSANIPGSSLVRAPVNLLGKLSQTLGYTTDFQANVKDYNVARNDVIGIGQQLLSGSGSSRALGQVLKQLEDIMPGTSGINPDTIKAADAQFNRARNMIYANLKQLTPHATLPASGDRIYTDINDFKSAHPEQTQRMADFARQNPNLSADDILKIFNN